jgi:hypothetical protein
MIRIERVLSANIRFEVPRKDIPYFQGTARSQADKDA